MDIKLAKLESWHLGTLLAQCNLGVMATALEQAYMSPGSVAYCMLNGGQPVFAGGIVNLQWNRGEAWMLPTPFFRSHLRVCYKYMREMVDLMARQGMFRRVQAQCLVSVSPSLFKHLKFESEGVMRCNGPSGEDCYMYSRIFKYKGHK